ncbi:MAG: hypothetical protein WCJ25_03155 [Candidatus Moraniibacteriota bacterium]
MCTHNESASERYMNWLSFCRAAGLPLTIGRERITEDKSDELIATITYTDEGVIVERHDDGAVSDVLNENGEACTIKYASAPGSEFIGHVRLNPEGAEVTTYDRERFKDLTGRYPKET